MRRVIVLGLGFSVFLGSVCIVGLSIVPAKPSCAFEDTDLEAAVKLFEKHQNDQGLHTLLQPGEDDGIIHRWLAENSEEYEAKKVDVDELQLIADALPTEVMRGGTDEAKNAEEVGKVMSKALGQTHFRRKSLADFVQSARSNATKLKKLQNITNMNVTEMGNLSKFLERMNETMDMLHVPKAKYSGGPQFPIQQHYLASCVINVLQATTFTAEAALDVNDAAVTCNRFQLGLDSKLACAANMGLIFESMAFIAAVLSLAANDCAATIIPNVDALCAASISALVAQVGQLSGGSALAAASCSPRALMSRLPPQIKPSNFGSGSLLGADVKWEDDRRLLQSLNITLPGRRLTIGGGPASNAGHCAIDILEVAWWLAQFAIAVNDAANAHVGNKCPPRNIFGGKSPKDIVYDVTQSYCTFDIGSAIFVFAEAIAFIQIAVVHCSDSFNEAAMCGGGISWLLGSLAGIAGSSASIHLSCGVFQGSIVHSALRGAAAWDDFTDGGITKIVGEDLGRRLSMAKSWEDKMEKTKARFETPEKAFMSLGFDITDKDAWWRHKSAPFIKDILNLVGEPGSSTIKDFQKDMAAQQTCS